MKKTQFAVLLFLICVALYPQERIEAEPELIANPPVGDGVTKIHYYADQDGVHTPGSPFIDASGRILVFRGDDLLALERQRVSSIPYQGKPTSFLLDGRRFFSSQQGIVVDYGRQLVFQKDRFFEYNLIDRGFEPEGRGYHTFPAPFGAILYSSDAKRGFGVVFDTRNPQNDFGVVQSDQLADWLKKQAGGFSIESNGLLYRHGTPWSAVKPVSTVYTDWQYLGKLLSGHSIWCSGDPPSARIFTISDAVGTIEISVHVPGPEVFTYGLGSWGEFYFLSAPPMDRRLDPLNDYYSPEPGTPAELVVVRNHLKYFGRLNDGGVRLRQEPNTTGKILGTYPAKTGFRILEKGTKEETIGGQKNVWYKIRLLDGNEGWFYGSFVQNLYEGPNGKAPPWPNVPDW